MSSAELLEELLLGLIRWVEPTDGQKADAQQTHNNLRYRLDSGNIGPRIIGSYLSGSYSRHTAIAPLDDVDIIFLIDASRWRRDFLEETPSPRKVLSTFEGAIRYRYQQSYVRMQRRSVGLKLQKMDIDVVPAIPKARTSNLIFVPDAESEQWIPSSPKAHAEAATRVNGQRGGQFIPLVKLLKFWNSQLPSTARLKSFAIETMAVRVFSSIGFDSYTKGLIRFFDFLASFSGDAQWSWSDDFGIKLGQGARTPFVPDVAATGSNLVADLGEDRRVKFLQHAVRSRSRLLGAFAAREPAGCEASIRSVFGI